MILFLPAEQAVSLAETQKSVSEAGETAGISNFQIFFKISDFFSFSVKWKSGNPGYNVSLLLLT